jgi:hypothetical protein
MKLAVMVSVFAVAACSKGSKAERESAAVKAKRAGVEAAIAATCEAPAATRGAKCERQGLTFSTNTPLVDGNAELIRVVKNSDCKISWQAPDVGPLGRLTFLGEDAEASAKKPYLKRAESTQVAVLLKELEHVNVAEAYLVELPAGHVVCSTLIEIEETEAPLYDPRTGARPTTNKYDADKARAKALFRVALDKELATRFGIGRKDTTDETPSPAAIAATQRFKKMVDALAGEPPACTDPDPAGTLRTTALRLRVYADAPLFTHHDLNYLVELDDFISPELRGLPAEGAQRTAMLATLAQAPATSVLDIPRGHLARAAFDGSDTFEPGAITARTVRFGADGAVVCQTKVELANAAQMTVKYDATYSTKDVGVLDASIDDFLKQLRSAFVK